MQTATNITTSLCLAISLVLPGLAVAGDLEDVTAAMARMQKASSYHATMETRGSSSGHTTLDFVAPDRYRVSNDQMGEQLIIGNTMLLQVNGRSMRLPLPQGTLSQWRDPVRLAKDARDITVTGLGSDPVAGKPAKKYRLHARQAESAPVTVWIDSDGYPARIVSQSGAGATSTIDYSRFNDPGIRIAGPE